MEAKELMIGDWCAYGVNCKGRVMALTEHLITLSVDGNEVNGLYMLIPDMIRPIPLTEEILVKNGVSEIHHPGTGATDEYSEWFLGGIKITEWLEDWKDHHFSTGGDDCSISFNYVHELQHLLRLCGIDKEISI